MSLYSPGPHAVDVYLLDDSATSDRGIRSQTRTLVRSAVNCWVREQAVGQTGANGRSMGFGHEVTRHKYQVLFGQNPSLTVAHLLVWVPPDESAAITMAVKGMARPQSRQMPYTAFCESFDSGEGAS